MRKFLTIALAALFAGNAMAMDNVPESGMTWVGYAGMTVSNLKNMAPSMNAKVGVTFGVKMDYMLPNAYGTYINAGLGWVQKGARVTNPEMVGTAACDVTRKFQSHYLELPIHVGYRYNFSEKFGIYGEVGPYFALGVTGKYKFKPEEDMVDDWSEMVFGKHYGLITTGIPGLDDIRAIQRFDCGFGFRVGAEFKNMYSLNFSYDWGFTDMYTDKYRKAYKSAVLTTYGLPKLKNRNMAITFGYRF